MSNFSYNLLEKAKKSNDIFAIEKMYNNNPQNPIIKFEYAKMLIKIKKFEKAKLLLEELLKIKFKDIKTESLVLLELGKIEFINGDFDKARDCFEKSINKNMDAYTMFELGKLELKQGNIEEAKKRFETAMSIKENLFAMYELGRIYVLENNVIEARKLFERILTRKTDLRTLIAIGKLEASDGNVSVAQKYFLKALEIKEDTEALEGLAKLEKNHAIVKEYLTRLIKIKYNPFTILELGRIELSLGNIDIARKYFESILNGETLTGALIELGNLEYKEGNIKKSKNYFEKALQDKEDDFVITKLVLLNIKMGNIEEAFQYFYEIKKRNVRTDLKIELYLMKKLNVFFENQIYVWNNYNNEQLLQYDEFTAIDHIIFNHKHQFSQNIDIYRLFQEIKKLLTPETKVGKLVFNDMYDIPFENVGENASALRVITLPNTNNILTMYPLYDNQMILEEQKLSMKLKK